KRPELTYYSKLKILNVDLYDFKEKRHSIHISEYAWKVNDKSTLLSVDENGLIVNYIERGENIKDAVIRADNPVPSECELFYFETDIIKEGTIAIGFCSNFDKINKMPGNYLLL
ncbi:19485_t:CDS:2, partial [Dentiscutata erythropus]